MKLLDHPKFKEDYERYATAISKISDEQEKTRLVGLLNQFVSAVKTIDQGHEDLMLLGQLPNSIADSKNKLVSLRKSLDTSLSFLTKTKN